MWVRPFTVMASLFLTACGGAAEASYQATQVTVYDLEHKILAELTSASQLEAFNRLWLTKQQNKGKRKSRSDFQFSIVIKAQSLGGIWLYARDGDITKLDHLSHPVYRVNDVSEFNRLIGVAQ
jgi:hypothetical protein